MLCLCESTVAPNDNSNNVCRNELYVVCLHLFVHIWTRMKKQLYAACVQHGAQCILSARVKEHSVSLVSLPCLAISNVRRVSGILFCHF